MNYIKQESSSKKWKPFKKIFSTTNSTKKAKTKSNPITVNLISNNDKQEFHVEKCCEEFFRNPSILKKY
jgi:hypothetical protein